MFRTQVLWLLAQVFFHKTFKITHLIFTFYLFNRFNLYLFLGLEVARISGWTHRFHLLHIFSLQQLKDHLNARRPGLDSARGPPLYQRGKICHISSAHVCHCTPRPRSPSICKAMWNRIQQTKSDITSAIFVELPRWIQRSCEDGLTWEEDAPFSSQLSHCLGVGLGVWHQNLTKGLHLC